MRLWQKRVLKSLKKRWAELGKGLREAIKVKKGDKKAISRTLKKAYPKIYGSEYKKPQYKKNR